MITILPIATVPSADVEHLLDLAFGTDRHQRTAYRLREGVDAIDALSFAAIEDGRLVGSIQCWPVQLTGPDGSATPLILIGPVAVHPDRQRGGIGRMLMEASLQKAEETSGEALMLIGDAIYYERFFGFTAGHGNEWTLPGPVDRDRLLTRLFPGQHLPRRAVLGPRGIAARDLKIA